MNKKINNPSILGCLPKAAFLNLVIWLIAFSIDKIFAGPKIAIEQSSSQVIFFVLTGLFLAVVFWSVNFLTSLDQQLSRRVAYFKAAGPYQYLRHPIYGAIVFLLNPALAIFLRSWLLLFACVLFYFIWKSAIFSEEKELIEFFGDAYKKYQRQTWPLFPNLLKINKKVFLAAWTLAIFLIFFMMFNFPSLSTKAREVGEQTIAGVNESSLTATLPVSRSAISLPANQPPINNQASINRPKPSYNRSNLIIISKLNINAPIVLPAGTSSEQLNAALNKGVILYPGSALPGQPGNVFLTGHSSTYFWNKTPYGRIFANLDKLSIGDIIIIYYNQHKYNYQVTKKYVTTPDKVTIAPFDLSAGQTITLMTCWPVGTADKRLVVEGEAVE